MNDEFAFTGKTNVPEDSRCCGWPDGCSNLDPTCRYLRHPYKRIVILGETPRPSDPQVLRDWYDKKVKQDGTDR